ncbi:aldo/keto reductase [Actinospica durhamensis]|uniref:Aldo/keto reductase n=1 Tax=Actinospica durhamensis TaxID=1508375 RepID=A0A941EXX8_9ACTN|nr:aldo/keto reductase [Actinospica durhamensis]MBR7835999.1 aldo/keto reductase [Actinospica durhamensis]
MQSDTWMLGDMAVSRIGFGAMRLTGSTAFDDRDAVPSDRARVTAVLRRAVELGVNHIDTAAFYFSPLRSANELINSALAPYADDLLIATKVGPARDASGASYAARPDQLRGHVEANLRQLGRDHLDLVYLRRMTQSSIAEHFGALAELREAGLVRHLGVSSVSLDHLAEAQAIAPVVAVQNRFSVDVHPGCDVLEACGAQGIAFVPYFAIAGSKREAGADPAGAQDERIQQVARVHGVTAAQVRLAWTLAHGPHVLAIPGTGDLAHLEQNIAAGRLRLSGEDLAALEGVGDGESTGTGGAAAGNRG